MKTKRGTPSKKAFLALTIFLFSMTILLAGCPLPQSRPTRTRGSRT